MVCLASTKHIEIDIQFIQDHEIKITTLYKNKKPE